MSKLMAKVWWPAIWPTHWIDFWSTTNFNCAECARLL